MESANISTLAGDPGGSQNGIGTAASFNWTCQIAMDAEGTFAVIVR